VSFSRAIDLGLTSKRRGHGGGGGKHEKRQAEEGKGPASYTDTLLVWGNCGRILWREGKSDAECEQEEGCEMHERRVSCYLTS